MNCESHVAVRSSGPQFAAQFARTPDPRTAELRGGAPLRIRNVPRYDEFVIGTREDWQGVFDSFGYPIGERWMVVPGDQREYERFAVGEGDLIILVNGRKKTIVRWIEFIAGERTTMDDLYHVYASGQLRSLGEAVGVFMMRHESKSHGAVGRGLHGHHMIPNQVACASKGHALGVEGPLRPPCDECGGRVSVPCV